MKTKITKQKRFLGSMIGLAVGDALGAPIEFLARDNYEKIESYKRGGKFNLELGEYTDDTAMALCLAQSLIEKEGMDQKDQLTKYLKWFKEGYMSATGRSIGCGKNTLLALSKFEFKGCSECGNRKLKKRAGNGSLMRISSVALYYADDLEFAMKMAAKSSYTTHGLKVCADSCSFMSALIVGAINNKNKDELLSSRYAKWAFELADIECSPELLEIVEGSYKNKSRDEISSSGYVINTMEAALWSFFHTENFNDGLILAVNLGYDSDTVGAVYGELAGAFYGIDEIREDLKDGVIRSEFIGDMALKLMRANQGARCAKKA